MRTCEVLFSGIPGMEMIIYWRAEGVSEEDHDTTETEEPIGNTPEQCAVAAFDAVNAFFDYTEVSDDHRSRCGKVLRKLVDKALCWLSHQESISRGILHRLKTGATGFFARREDSQRQCHRTFRDRFQERPAFLQRLYLQFAASLPDLRECSVAGVQQRNLECV